MAVFFIIQGVVNVETELPEVVSERKLSRIKSGAIATNIDPGRWQVFCLNCLSSLGTMSIATLKYAIDYNRDRGGIVCPDCRNNMCKSCHKYIDLPAYAGLIGIRVNAAKMRIEMKCAECITPGDGFAVGTIRGGEENEDFDLVRETVLLGELR